MSPDASPSRAPLAASIERITAHNADTRSLFLRVPPGHALTFLPGQFISLQLPVRGETLIRPYSIASGPDRPELIEICLNLVPGGAGSGYLFGLAEGATVNFTGPWGTFTLREPPAADCVFIADGTGVAPIRPMLHRVLGVSAPHLVRLHYRAAGVDAVLYRDEFEAAQRAHPRFRFDPMISASSDDLLELADARYLKGDDDRRRHFFICGVGDVVTKLRDLLRGGGYQRRAVQYEKW